MHVITTEKKQFMVDTYDKKILSYLGEDLRYPRKQLARILQISQQKLQYRIKRLSQELIQPAITLNFPSLGIASVIILIKRLPEETLKELERREDIYFIFELLGEYNWLLHVFTDDAIAWCAEHLPEEKIEIYKVTKFLPDNFNPFGVLEVKRKIPQEIELDSIDYKILISLSKDPLKSYVGVGQETGVDRGTISKRVKKLLDGDIIQRFRYVINIFRYGFLFYTVKLIVQPKQFAKVYDEIYRNKYSGFTYQCGNILFLQYHPQDHLALHELVETLKGIDKELQVVVMQNTNYYSFNVVPKKVLDEFTKRLLP